MDQSGNIDFVITWVDGSDPVWRKQRDAYSHRMNIPKDENTMINGVDMRENRYRDYGLLVYWFRAVERYAPWVRKVHFVTWGHIPNWLNTDCLRLNIVRHEDFIPAEFLSTFNCNAIELNLHRIRGLSEHFVYFNDDIFPISSLKKTDFFRDGKPCDMLAFQPVVANPANPVMSYLYLNDALVISRHFDKRDNIRKQPGKYFKLGYPPMYFIYNALELAFPKFTGFYNVHGAVPLCRQTYFDLWEKEEWQLRETSSHRFRSKNDLTIHLIRDWQKLNGNFKAVNLLRSFEYFELSDNNEKLYDTLRKRRRKIICINDADTAIDFERTKLELKAVFDELLPARSAFEKGNSERNAR